MSETRRERAGHVPDADYGIGGGPVVRQPASEPASERKAAAEQALCRAADAYVWDPNDATMEALRNARAEWQTAVGLHKLAALAAARGDTP